MRLSCLVVVGCHFAPADVTGAAGDAMVDTHGDVMHDSPRDSSQTCMQRWLAQTPRFTAPVQLANVNSAGYDRDPFVTTDGLTFYVSTDRGGTGHPEIYMATRTDPVGAFGTPAVVAALSPANSSESKVSITAAGTYAVVGSDLAGGAGGIDVWETSRASATAGWGPLGRGHVMAVETTGNDHDPEISIDGLHLYLAPDGGGQHIVLATRTSTTANFSAPATITELQDPGGASDGDPTVSPDERVIVFSSGRTAANAGGNLWYAVRATANGTFSTPVVVPDVNTDANDGDPHLSTDGCHLYYSNDSGGDWNIYTSTML